MLRIGTICLHADNEARGAAFWSAALGYTPRPDAADMLQPPGGVGPQLGIYGDQPHLDLYTDGAADQLVQIDRLQSLGAVRVTDWPYPADADFVVMRDPEGNLFCVVDHD